MPEPQSKIAELEARLDALVRTQVDFQTEISSIREQLAGLRQADAAARDADLTTPLPVAAAPEPISSVGRGVKPEAEVRYDTSPLPVIKDVPTEIPPPTFGIGNTQTTGDESTRPNSGFSNFASRYAASARGDLERFIGENLISLVGVIVLVLGVGIGAKYAIDNGWVSPLIRIIFGYAVGFALVGTATKLKAKYHDFSAVLLSGGMAIMYFVTYFAYAYYALMPQSAAFALMVIFDAFTVAAAVVYNRQVIAHIGLVGAYAVPFLLSDNSGNYLVLFSYMAIVNVAVLAISVIKYWKVLYYAAFVLTWLIYYAWFDSRYSAVEHFYLGLTFASVFFVIFYVTKLIHGFLHSEHEDAENSIGLLSNSFIFYGFGMSIMHGRLETRPLEGLFTAGHALLHSITAHIVSRVRPEAVGLVRLLAILIITFATIAVPVQFDGHAVTLIWAVEAAVLFWVGRERLVSTFEYYSYPVMAAAAISLCVDWINMYLESTKATSELHRRPLANGEFVTGVVFVAAFALICWVDRRSREYSVLPRDLVRNVGVIIATVLVAALYNVFRIEIGNYYQLQLAGRLSIGPLDSILAITPERGLEDLVRFNSIWQLNYTMVFLSALALLNIRRLRSAFAAIAGITASGVVLSIFLTVGMVLFYDLRVSYMTAAEPVGLMNIAIRYITYLAVAAMLAGIYWTLRSDLTADIITEPNHEFFWDILLYFTLLVIASCELINLMAQLYIPNSTKLGLSVLWGIYALILISVGIAWNKKDLRIGAIALLVVTLVKLFFYDVADLPTIPKTALFVSLGILLLVISFLYNKFAARIFKRTTPDEP